MITNENYIDYVGGVTHIKADLPIWKEFLVGLNYGGSISINNPLSGFRLAYGTVPNSNKHRDICILSNGHKARREFIEWRNENYLTDILFGKIKDLRINKYKRRGKDVFVYEYET